MKKTPQIFRTLFQTASVTVLGALGVVGVGILLFLFNLVRGLPDVASLKTFQHSHATEVFSADAKKIGEFTTERRYPVRFETIPQHVVYAFVAAEDAHFFQHKGIDFGGILRAIYSNVTQGRYAQGGSTITQQVARGILLETRKKEITRKIRELILARRMEKQLTKNEILALYLSEIYLGHGSYGLGAAAKNYFKKAVEDLTVAEGALLAGLPQRPNDWDPFHSPLMAKRRQTYVLKRMLEERFITEEQHRAALSQDLKLYPLRDSTQTAAPYFTEYVRQYLMGKYGSEAILSQGYKVYTTVSFDQQKSAERALLRGLREVDKRLGWRGPLRSLATQEEMSVFSAKLHDATLDALDPTRVLPAVPDPTMKRLAFDLSPYQDKASPYVGETPIQEGTYYQAVVVGVQDEKQLAAVQIGLTRAIVPFTTAAWVKLNEIPAKNFSQFLKVGDVIEVRIDKTDKRTGSAIASLEQPPEVQGAILSYEVENGQVRAMVGGTDFTKAKFNIALQAKRQVGSTFKPVIYAAAMDKGYSPSSIVTDSPLVFEYEGQLDADNQGEAWRPHNYSGKFEGDIPLRLALIRSMNIPTVKLLNELTVDYGIQYARSLGITAVLPRDLTIGLGSWSSSLEELMRAYAVFPRLGRPLSLKYITKILAPDGSVLEDNTQAVPVAVTRSTVLGENPLASPSPSPGDTVISPQTAYVMTDLLKGVVREGTGRGAFLSQYPIAGKTGTSNDHRDAWFVGYSPQLMAGVWIGYEKDKALDAAETGGKAAAPIFAEYMANALKEYPKSEFPIPDDIAFAYVDKDTGRLAASGSPSRVRVAFKVGTVPNLRGDNIRRIGEPGGASAGAADNLPGGSMGRATGSEGSVSEPGLDEAPAQEETSDFLREGYE